MANGTLAQWRKERTPDAAEARRLVRPQWLSGQWSKFIGKRLDARGSWGHPTSSHGRNCSWRFTRSTWFDIELSLWVHVTRGTSSLIPNITAKLLILDWRVIVRPLSRHLPGHSAPISLRRNCLACVPDAASPNAMTIMIFNIEIKQWKRTSTLSVAFIMPCVLSHLVGLFKALSFDCTDILRYCTFSWQNRASNRAALQWWKTLRSIGKSRDGGWDMESHPELLEIQTFWTPNNGWNRNKLWKSGRSRLYRVRFCNVSARHIIRFLLCRVACAPMASQNWIDIANNVL